MAQNKKKAGSNHELPPHIKKYASQPGEARCLKCHNSFLSPDKMRIRTCSKCSRDNADVYIPAEMTAPPSLEGPDMDGY